MEMACPMGRLATPGGSIGEKERSPATFGAGTYPTKEVMVRQSEEIDRLALIIKSAYRKLKVDGPNTLEVNDILLQLYDRRTV